jgi:2-polyprenyl-3-methyl-5-hydroxy-6-metoxy-1,4-benzoquinol methylase
MPRKVKQKSNHQISNEWDELAPIRFAQIKTGRDITYCNVIIPQMLSMISESSAREVADAGCGVGILTDLLAGMFENVIGVDLSNTSIEIARKYYGNRAHFISGSFEHFAEERSESFDLVVANMVLMDTLDLPSFVKAVARVLRKNGRFVFSLTHPWFWPEYAGYAHKKWFKYAGSTIIEAPFRISHDRKCSLQSTHVHRPLESYLRAFHDEGLLVSEVREPLPPRHIERLYPQKWKRPRYLFGACVKHRTTMNTALSFKDTFSEQDDAIPPEPKLRGDFTELAAEAIRSFYLNLHQEPPTPKKYRRRKGTSNKAP